MKDEKDNDKHKHPKGDESIKTDSLLRETSSRYIRLIGDADRKARIMLIVNSILLTIGITIITEAINHIQYVWISATILICSNVMTLFFSVLSIKPELPTRFAKETENNILHYKKCSEYALKDYTRLMLDTVNDNEKKMDAIILELYYYGNLLSKKYNLIKMAYQFFLWGIVVSVISYLIILFIKSA